MKQVLVTMPETVRRAIWAHLLQEGKNSEQAGFVFARCTREDEQIQFAYLEWWPLAAKDLASASAWYLEVADEAKARAIKRAHDLDSSLIEFHSHMGTWPAMFSESDWNGFAEFVPHIWWRLKGKPYGAVVVAASGFDALAWVDDPRRPQQLDGIQTEEGTVRPTALSLNGQRDEKNE